LGVIACHSSYELKFQLQIFFDDNPRREDQNACDS
jgi:hypothetical protein